MFFQAGVSIRPTDPISGNAFDAKRKKKVGDGGRGAGGGGGGKALYLIKTRLSVTSRYRFLESRINYPSTSVKSAIKFLIPGITNRGLKRSS